MIVATHRHRHMNDFIHDVRFLSAASTLELATFCLVLSGPQVLPVVVVSFAIGTHVSVSTIAWPQKPQKKTPVALVSSISAESLYVSQPKRVKRQSGNSSRAAARHKHHGRQRYPA
eukprot:Skav231324  [mRNA]  locus=scaffold819:14817:15296:+ [translate_table: standard]